ncbi:MAG: hypothetical protein ACRDKS_13705 [Actinomycetota bacterium]
MEQVRLPELETIRRFSIAVRSEHAPAEQVIEALRQDLERVEGALKGRRTTTTRRSSGARTTNKSSRR